MVLDLSIQQSGMNVGQNVGLATSSAAVGSLFGHAATVVESPMSLLADAAEELTFAVDSTDDFELEERKERDKISEALEERVKKYQELMREKGAAEQIHQLADSIRARAAREEALRQAREYFPDPSDAWAALKAVRDELAGEPDSAKALQAVDEALAELEASQGAAIRSGICGALNASGFESLGSSEQLGALYRGVVCDFGDVNEVFAHIQTTYGKDFDAALDFLYKALASDMAADTSSMEKSHLEHINNNLGELRQLQSARSLCARLLERWDTVHGIKDCPLDDMALLGKIIALRKENYISGSQIARLADEARAPDIERKVLFLQELLNVSRSFTPMLFDGTEGRMRVIGAIQDAVDTAIAEEDQWLASQG
ncbi:MAG: type III secretion system gatekeeper subunit SctW [Desulfovibrio sp.]|nr:type III secretion system gatekeeper subunit SctW [Desulfovibrio sp.]